MGFVYIVTVHCNNIILTVRIYSNGDSPVIFFTLSLIFNAGIEFASSLLYFQTNKCKLKRRFSLGLFCTESYSLPSSLSLSKSLSLTLSYSLLLPIFLFLSLSSSFVLTLSHLSCPCSHRLMLPFCEAHRLIPSFHFLSYSFPSSRVLLQLPPYFTSIQRLIHSRDCKQTS